MPLEPISAVSKSLSDAIESEDNELVSMRNPKLKEQFFDSITANKGELEDLICQILQVKKCRITPLEIWDHGSFNVAIKVRLPFGKDAYLRIPFLHRIGEHTFPGNAEEKIRTESATYLWLQEYCPDVAIPTLYAFGLPDGSIDSKLRTQPNAIFDIDDGQRQMAASVGMRAVTHLFMQKTSRRGPFYLTLNDLNQKNIFVDEHWNIKTIIDLEWAHTLPIEMKTPPYWLTSRPVDGFMEPSHRQEYEQVLEEYLSIYEQEEIQRRGSTRETTTQRQVWQNGSFWFYKAVMIPKAKYNLFNWHIQSMFNEDHPNLSIFDEIFHFYWGLDASKVIDAKIEERTAYIEDVKKLHRSILEEGEV
ncbi:hypothetical protein MY11210_006785 [Beauveria gryllotalpidicola]